MNQSRLTYVIHGQSVPDKNRLMTHLIALNPVAIIVMDEAGLARELKDRFPSSTVIYRFNGDGGDGDLHMRYMPQEWLDKMIAKLGGDKRIMLMTTNEPTLSRRLVKWHEDLIPLANKAGVSLCVLNLATGNPQPEVRDDKGNIIKESEWEIAKPLLELLAVHRQHILGVHSYAGGVVTSGLYGGYPDNAGVAPGKPGGKSLIQPENWPPSVDGITCYHMGRFKFLLEYCARQHIDYPRIGVTEHSFDDTSDIKPYLSTLKKTAPFQNIRAYKSLRNQWAEWYGARGWSLGRTLGEMLTWSDRVIYRHSPVEFQAVFCWGHSSDDWIPFDVSDDTDYQTFIAAYVKETEPVPVPTAPPFPFEPTDWRAITMRINARDNAKNLRAGPGTQFAVLRDWVQELVTFIPFNLLDTNSQYEDAEGNKWIPMVMESQQGWASHKVVIEDLVNYQKTPPPPPPPFPDDDPPPPPPSEPSERELWDIQAKRLYTQYAELHLELSGINKRLALVEASLAELFDKEREIIRNERLAKVA